MERCANSLHNSTSGCKGQVIYLEICVSHLVFIVILCRQQTIYKRIKTDFKSADKLDGIARERRGSFVEDAQGLEMHKDAQPVSYINEESCCLTTKVKVQAYNQLCFPVVFVTFMHPFYYLISPGFISCRPHLCHCGSMQNQSLSL